MNDAIQQLLPPDFAEITDVWEASVRATHDFLGEADIQKMKPLVRDEYLYLVTLFGLRGADGSLLGFIGVAGNKIEMLFIHPDARGKGIGKQLLGYAVDHLGTDEVDVNEQNGQAVGFYRHAGFQVTGRSERDGQGQPFPLLHLKRVRE
ncbi:MAG: GNAT family N-acetyltransferase [Cytophagales bacterium]|nr:GNAT family N-acetyltransferase [Cytophagales bacterium]